MEYTWVKCTHPSNTPTRTLQLSSNITNVTHLSSCTLTRFSFHDTSKWSQFSSDHAIWKSQSWHYSTSEFHKLGIYPEQIMCFITNHTNITLKYHSNHSNLPTYVPRPLSKKSNFFTFFIFNPMVAQVKIHKYLILLYIHHLPTMPFKYLCMEKIWIFFYTHLWLTTHFVPPTAQVPKIIVRQP